jgi:hypothetical protein
MNPRGGDFYLATSGDRNLAVDKYAAHYADYKTSSAAPSSGNATAGHITQPSA